MQRRVVQQTRHDEALDIVVPGLDGEYGGGREVPGMKVERS